MTFSTEKIRSAIDSRRTVAIVWAALWLLSLVALAARVPDGRLTDILSAGAPLWKTRVLTYLLHIAAITLSGLLLLRLDNACNLMQKRTWLPATLFFFFNACDPALADRFNIGIVMSPLLVVWLYLLFGSYQKPGQEAAFAIGLLISAAALLWPPTAWWLIAFALGLVYMKAFTWRSITALILGVATTVWLLYSIGQLFDLTLFYPFESFIDLDTHLPFAMQVGTDSDLIRFGIIVLIGIGSCLSGCYLISRNKIQIWRSNRFLEVLFLFVAADALLNPSRMGDFLPLLHLLAAQAGSYYLIHARNRYVAYQACVVAVVYLTLFLWNF